MTEKIHNESVKDILSGLQSKRFSRDEIFLSFLNTVYQDEELLVWQNFLKSLPPRASRDGALSDVLVGVKDNIATKEFPTTMGVGSWRGTTGGFDARVVAKLREAGCVIAGKTRCSAFAVHDITGTRNPRYADSEPGTSSSGSAAAVAALHVPIALGTQTAGSISKPASYCGVIGFKPTFGDLPRTGVLKTTEMFDSVGFLGRRISDISAFYMESRVSGTDHPIHEKQRGLIRGLHFKKALILAGPGVDNPSHLLRRRFLEAVQTISETFSFVVEPLPSFDFDALRDSLFKIYYRELSYFLRDQEFSNNVSSSLQNIIDYGTKVTLTEYKIAKELVFAWRKIVANLSKDTLIFSLAASSSAPRLGKPDLIDANFFITSAGIPQLSVPILRDQDGRLVNLSLSSTRYTDENLLRLGCDFFQQDALSVSSFG